MEKKKTYNLFLLTIFMVFLSFVVSTPTVQSKSDVKLKVLSVKQKKGRYSIEMKISNSTKSFVEFSDDIVLYEKRKKKWKKIKWNKHHCTSDTLYGLNPGTSGTYTFFINQEELTRKIMRGKKYRIGIEIDGKYKKTKKIRLKKRAS